MTDKHKARRFLPHAYRRIQEQAEIAELFFDKGADVKSPSPNGGTALNEASVTDDQRLALLLIKRGAKVNAKDDDRKRAPSPVVKKDPRLRRVKEARLRPGAKKKWLCSAFWYSCGTAQLNLDSQVSFDDLN